MPRRPATITQADVARAIRAVQAAGLPIVRVVVRGDGVAVETSAAGEAPAARIEDIEEDDVMVL